MATVPEGKVRIIGGRAYGPGAELPGGKAVAVKSSDELPADFPHRELLASGGVTTRAQVAEASDEKLLAIDGIAEGRLKDIRKAEKALK